MFNKSNKNTEKKKKERTEKELKSDEGGKKVDDDCPMCHIPQDVLDQLNTK